MEDGTWWRMSDSSKTQTRLKSTKLDIQKSGLMAVYVRDQWEPVGVRNIPRYLSDMIDIIKFLESHLDVYHQTTPDIIWQGIKFITQLFKESKEEGNLLLGQLLIEPDYFLTWCHNDLVDHLLEEKNE